MKFKLTLTKIILILSIAATSDLSAQKSIADIAEMSDKKWDKFVASDFPGYDYLHGLVNTGLLDAENTPQPKRIGILTLQLFSLSSVSSNEVGGWVYTNTYSTTGEGEGFLVDQMMNMIVPEMKEAFQQAGYELLTPQQFIETPEQREAYEQGANTIEASGLTKLAWGSLFSGADQNYEGVVPDGYQFYPIAPHALAGDIKGPAGYGRLAEELGLDGVLILSLTSVTSKKYVALDNFSAVIAGPIDDNKEAEYKGRIGAGNMNRSRDGIVYSYAGFDVDELPLLKLKKDQFVEYYYEKFNVIAGRLGEKLVENLDEVKAYEPKGKKRK